MTEWLPELVGAAMLAALWAWSWWQRRRGGPLEGEAGRG